MTDSSASECSGTPVITDLRSLPRVQSITEQSNYASFTQAEYADSDNPSIFEDLPRITIYIREGRKQYIDARLLNNRVERRLWIWLHKHDLMEVGTKKPSWACNLCDAKNKSNGIYSTQSISGPERHLQVYTLLRWWFKEVSFK